jgi:hypothetical protein
MRFASPGCAVDAQARKDSIAAMGLGRHRTVAARANSIAILLGRKIENIVKNH